MSNTRDESPLESDSDDEPLAKMVRRSGSGSQQSSDENATSQPANQPSTQDSTKPKPLTAFAHFFNETQQSIRNKNASATFSEVSAIVMSMWESLDANTRLIYQKREEEDRRKLEESLDAVLPDMLKAADKVEETKQESDGEQAAMEAEGTTSHKMETEETTAETIETEGTTTETMEAEGKSEQAIEVSPQAQLSQSERLTAEAVPKLPGVTVLAAPASTHQSNNKPMVVPVISHKSPVPIKMISIDSSNKLKVITKEPGTADGSSMLSVKGVTIIQGNKATVMSQPTPKIITASGIATGSRPPVKYIFSTGQGGGVAAGAVTGPGPVRVITVVSQGLTTNTSTSAAVSKTTTITHPIIIKSNTNNDAKPTSTTQIHTPNVMPSAGTAPSKASDFIEPESQLDNKNETKARKSPSPTNLQTCTLESCQNPPIKHKKWDDNFCSSKCLVEHTREAFQSWVAKRKGQTA